MNAKKISGKNKSKLKHSFLFKIIIILIIAETFCRANTSVDPVSNDNHPKNAIINLNNWVYWQSYDGTSGFNPYIGDCGGIYPHGTANVIFQDGLVWGGYVQDHNELLPALRAGGQKYSVGTQPGWIETPGDGINAPAAISISDPRVRIYRVRSDIATVSDEELKREVADYFDILESEVTQSQIEAVRNQYIQDWLDWPADIGAPYYDRNRNGQWDVYYDEPGIVDANQIIWYVVNDLSDSVSKSLFGSPHIGLELQVTVWVYNFKRYALGQVIFKRYRIINKSGFQIDSMFVGQWVDPDLGNYSDDFVGCDSLKDFGYCYNSSLDDDIFINFELPPPAVGYILLQGPKVPSFGDFAFYNFQYIEDYKNLGMTSFGIEMPDAGWIIPINYISTICMYNFLNGYLRTDGLVSFTHGSGANAGQPTKFPLNGNPVTGEGDIDGQGSNLSPGDRRFLISSGPFCMQPSDTQDVVFAIVGADSGTVGDNLSSVAKLQQSVKIIRKFYKGLSGYIPPEGELRFKVPEISHNHPGIKRFILGQNYPNPFNDGTTVRFKLYGEMYVKLEVYNINGEKIKTIFEGQRKVDEYYFSWDGCNNQGVKMPSGIYILSLSNDIEIQTKKIVLIK